MNQTLLLTVGLPRSGKSTWARSIGYPIVEPDAIRLAMHGHAFIGEAEPMIWTMAKYMVRSLFLAGHERVILSACSHTEHRRLEWNSKQWQTKYIVFTTPKEECIRRAISNNQEYLIDVIERMNKEWQEPEADKVLEYRHVIK